jgi:hypothetical protein
VNAEGYCCTSLAARASTGDGHLNLETVRSKQLIRVQKGGSKVVPPATSIPTHPCCVR